MYVPSAVPTPTGVASTTSTPFEGTSWTAGARSALQKWRVACTLTVDPSVARTTVLPLVFTTRTDVSPAAGALSARLSCRGGVPNGIWTIGHGIGSDMGPRLYGPVTVATPAAATSKPIKTSALAPTMASGVRAAAGISLRTSTQTPIAMRLSGQYCASHQYCAKGTPNMVACTNAPNPISSMPGSTGQTAWGRPAIA